MLLRNDKGRPIVALMLIGILGLPLMPLSHAETVVAPESISIGAGSPVCAGAEFTQEVCITLPEESIVENVDVCFLFDDTGSFASFVPTVTGIFADLVADLEFALPDVEFGFCVGRYEDYGGPGTGFSDEYASGRPFILNQPVVTSADAGGDAARDGLIATALSNRAPGFGGDGPESAIGEGLCQLATGVGFDGDGDGFTTGSPVGSRPAGALLTQIAPGASGDVPDYASLEAGVIASGTAGGAGWRSNALRLAIMATDVCPISAFDSGLGIPATIDGAGGSEPVADFACYSTTPGNYRFGYVSDSLTSAGNTIPGAVVPAGACTVQGTVDDLNSAGIRVMGMAPYGAPTPSGSGPSFSPSVFLSAIARLTGALDEFGNPLVFDIGAGGDPLKDAIVEAILTTTTLPIDISLMTSDTIPDGLEVSVSPEIVPDVAPGETACFDVTFSGTGSNPMGSFDLNFTDDASGAVLGTIPVDADCPECIDPDPLSQGYWHRQCLGLSEREGGIDPGRDARGPQSPTEPLFAEELMPCAYDMLEDLGLYGLTTCGGMDADPPSDECEKAKKQLTALILNVCSGRLQGGCAVAADGCLSTSVSSLLGEISGLIMTGSCQQAQTCADQVNTGDALVGGDGESVFGARQSIEPDAITPVERMRPRVRGGTISNLNREGGKRGSPR